METTFNTSSAKETRDLASKIISDFIISKKNHIILLVGDLGSGKTTFTQGLAEYFNIHDKIQSPTFVLEKKYNIKFNKYFNELVHIDLYRLEKQDETVRDLSENFKTPNYLTIIEWPEKLGKYKPKKYIEIKFYYIDNSDKRKIIIKDFS